METVGVWDWFWLILLAVIPIVNIIAFVMFAYGHGNRNVVNLCRAIMLWFLVGLAISLVGSLVSAIFGI